MDDSSKLLIGLFIHSFFTRKGQLVPGQGALPVGLSQQLHAPSSGGLDVPVVGLPVVQLALYQLESALLYGLHSRVEEPLHVLRAGRSGERTLVVVDSVAAETQGEALAQVGARIGVEALKVVVPEVVHGFEEDPVDGVVGVLVLVDDVHLQVVLLPVESVLGRGVEVELDGSEDLLLAVGGEADGGQVEGVLEADAAGGSLDVVFWGLGDGELGVGGEAFGGRDRTDGNGRLVLASGAISFPG